MSNPARAATSPITLTALTNGTPYTARVRSYDLIVPASGDVDGNRQYGPYSAPSAPFTPVAPPLWESDFAEFAVGAAPPYPPDWYDTPWNFEGGGSAAIIADARRTGGRALECRAPSGSGLIRAEQSPTIGLGHNTERWLGFDFQLPTNVTVVSGNEMVMQAKDNTYDDYPPWQITFGHSTDALQIGGFAAGYDSWQIGSRPIGVWTRIVVGVYTSNVVGTGWLEVWRDGSQVLSRQSSYHSRSLNQINGSTAFGTTGCYLKFGAYGDARTWAHANRYTQLKVGATRASAE